MIRIPSHAPNDERGTLGTQVQRKSDILTLLEKDIIAVRITDFTKIGYSD